MISTTNELKVPDLPLPPRSVRNHDDESYVRSARANIRHIVDSVGILPNHNVLDIGCAAGRLSLPLACLLDSTQGGGYLGLDVKKAAIQWAQENISTRYSHIQFKHLDARSSVMNPTGALEPSHVHLPASDRTFDLVILHSVFTHMLTDGVRHYLSEIARCLKPGGILYFTAMLFDKEAQEACEMGEAAWNFESRLGNVMVFDPKRPELAVALLEEFAYRVTYENGFMLYNLRKGTWREGHRGGQDVLFFKKA